MNSPILYRKRLIPNECILLKNDRIMNFDKHYIVTNWQALHKKPDLDHGYSYYCLENGFKISKFLKATGELLYWYCDIVEYENIKKDNSIIVTDLLADVIVKADGSIKVVDLDELVEAFDQKLINERQFKESILKLNHLLTLIYSGEWLKYQNIINEYIKKDISL